MFTKTNQNQKKTQKFSSEDIYIMDKILSAETFYDAILGQLKIDQNDEIYRNLVLGSLKRQTKDRLVFSIWKHLDAKQMAHLRNFIDESAYTAPFMDLDDVMMTFANLYPTLMTKVYADLTEFFQNFIKNFNEISETSI
ncbi:MAG: hypothetical protein WC285_04760 [Candidatus Gracilibacteria bacterium]|jgi:hypothetical protein